MRRVIVDCLRGDNLHWSRKTFWLCTVAVYVATRQLITLHRGLFDFCNRRQAALALCVVSPPTLAKCCFMYCCNSTSSILHFTQLVFLFIYVFFSLCAHGEWRLFVLSSGSVLAYTCLLAWLIGMHLLLFIVSPEHQREPWTAWGVHTD